MNSVNREMVAKLVSVETVCRHNYCVQVSKTTPSLDLLILASHINSTPDLKWAGLVATRWFLIQFLSFNYLQFNISAKKGNFPTFLCAMEGV